MNRYNIENFTGIYKTDIVEEHWVNGKLHRVKEPAVIYYDGRFEYWEHGEFLGSRRPYETLVIKGNVTPYYKAPEDYSGKIKSHYGPRVCFYEKGIIHRTDGPAFIENNEGKKACAWFLKGKMHRRQNMPASIESTKNMMKLQWFIEGDFHRTNGPATLNFYYSKQEIKIEVGYYLKGRFLSKEQYFDKLSDRDKIKAISNPETFLEQSFSAISLEGVSEMIKIYQDELELYKGDLI